MGLLKIFTKIGDISVIGMADQVFMFPAVAGAFVVLTGILFGSSTSETRKDST